MLTVGQLAQHLSTLDPTLPIGIIDIDRHPSSQRATITLRELTDVDVIHEARTGVPQAVWLTAQPSGGQPDPLTGRSPSTVVLPSHPCGCLVLIAVADGRSVNLDAFPRPHHQPNDLVIRSAAPSLVLAPRCERQIRAQRPHLPVRPRRHPPPVRDTSTPWSRRRRPS